MSDSVRLRNKEAELYPDLTAAHGFVPNLFRVQGELPRAIEAEERLICAVVLSESALSRPQKQSLLHGVASVWTNDYCLALYGQSLPVVADADAALLRFCLKLARHGAWFSKKDVETLGGSGFDAPAILDAIAVTALGQMLCTLAEGLHPALDSRTAPPVSSGHEPLPDSFHWVEIPGPYLPTGAGLGNDFGPYTALRDQLGFVPNLFRAQGLRPDLIDAEVQALERMLFTEDVLSRVQKESILMAVSAANLNTYFVAVHRQVLSALGVPWEDADQIVEDHQSATISLADKALLSEVRKLSPALGRSESQFDTRTLQAHGFSEPQVLEALAMAALTNFLNTMQAGLGAIPDFPPRRVFTPKDLYPLSGNARPISDASPIDDPDAALVARVRNGEIDVFEELVRRHSRRVFGTLSGIVGNVDDARDATQDVFLKAFENIDRFQGRAKFSTWLVSIAINTGTEILRQRKPSESLDDQEDGEGFRPRQIQSWADNPEQMFAASQRRALVREGVLRLPEKYRVAVLLRDINQLSTEEAASAMGLSVPALKARLLRGRLMLRESLSTHFARVEGKES